MSEQQLDQEKMNEDRIKLDGMITKDISSFINQNPEVTSLLYDMNLLPEVLRSQKEVTVGLSRGYTTMLNVVFHFQKFRTRIEGQDV